ncbi:MAG: ATP-binding protein [Burkholderiaceae bacterium]|nr:ATP-binding protein [Burkholderiaceae bacterium]
MALPRFAPRHAAPAFVRCVACGLLAVLLGWAGAAVAQDGAAPRPAQVLVINGADAYLPAFVAIDAAMRASVQRGVDRPVVWLYETLDALRFAEGGLGPEMAEVLARKYRDTRIDAVVLVAEPALRFYLRHRERLWPLVPVVFHSVPSSTVRGLEIGAGVSGVPFDADYEQTLRIARSLQPRARRVVVVSGVSSFDEAELRRARRALQTDADRLAVEYLVGATPAEMAERLSRETLDTIVLYLSMFRDAGGQVHTPREVLARISAASGAPVYGVHDTFMGQGLAAGALEPYPVRGERAGELLAEALRSPGVAAARVMAAPASHCVADNRQLERHRLSARALPEGCELRHVEPSVLQRYWWQSLLVVLALVLQSALIAALLLQRRRRRQAELGLQAQRAQLLHASRLAVAGELTAAIAHEINQPLGAILSNADAAEMLLQSGRISREELLQILADIRRDDLRASAVIKRLRALLARHDVDRQPLHANQVAEDAGAILRPEARRRGATLELALQARHDEVLGDPVQLQQVLINLVLNAFDAMGASPPEHRRVRVGTTDAAAGVQIGVRDFGPGIAAADLPRVFDPFFSSKASGMGLGLSIARSIVEAHGGTITAANREPGAEFRVTLPLAPTHDPSETLASRSA